MTRANVATQLFVVFLILFSNIVYADDCKPWVAKAISIQGNVERRTNTDQSTSQWHAIKRDDELCAGEIIRVKQNSRAALILKNDTILRLNQNTTITLSSLSEDQSHWINLEQGIAHFIARIKQSFKVITPFVNAAVEGTEFVVSVNNTQTEVTVFEGKVNVKNNLGEVKLIKGQTAITADKSIPILTIRVKPRDAVQWSLYYPAIINFESTLYQDFDPDSKIIIERSITAARNGLYTTALEQINLIREAEINSMLLTYRAALYLSVGRIGKAKQDIHQVIQEQPDNAQAIAIQAIFAIVQNNKTKALALAEQAAILAPNNASTVLALSYVHQSLFDINSALQIIKNATTTNKNNALVWSRLSELYLMVGDLDEALKAAKQANDLNPNIARTHSALGFAYLLRIEVKKAEQAFTNAIEIDDSDPLSRLGLGLAIIRQGKLEQGRQQIEFAATLDPNNALIRSYLGKAYYEEKRDKLATTQFEMAKQLDPNDPTSYYYNAIQLQSINRPVEALEELEKSVKLNNNNAVYRSKLKLDKDNAARTASLAIIYQELRFDIQAQKKAFKALNQDFSNNSAHRFLAEAYRTRPRYEIARVSETLQAQLLAPINIKPSTPSITETNLSTLPNTGPGQSSLGNYDPLFTRNSSRFNISTIIGNNQTIGDELNYSKIINKTVVSFGQYYYETKGFRPNNDLEQKILNFFIQSNFVFHHNIQFEIKNSKKENGDLRLKFDPNNFSENLHETYDNNSFRLGYNWQTSINSYLIFSSIYTNLDSTTNEKNLVSLTAAPGGQPLYTIRTKDEERDALNLEVQYLHNKNSLQIITGLGDFDQKNNTNSNFQFATEDDTILQNNPKIGTTNRTHLNGYIYNYFNPNNKIHLTIGVSNDKFNRKEVYTEKQWNPKFGFVYNSTPATSFHIAGFRTLKRTLISNQTIEPTQIAGINQFFDDPTATDAKNYAILIKHNFTNSIYSGIETQIRDLSIPVVTSSKVVSTEIQKENLSQFYLHWKINNDYSAGIEYSYEKFEKEDRPKILKTQPNYLRTKKIPVFITYHNSFGITARLTSTNFEQNLTHPKGTFNSRTFKSESDKFWLFDFELGYKLPNRYGYFSAVINNLLDKEFNYYNTKFRTDTALPPEISHERSVVFKLDFSFY